MSRKGKLSGPFPIFEVLWEKLAKLPSTRYRAQHYAYITSFNLKIIRRGSTFYLSNPFPDFIFPITL